MKNLEPLKQLIATHALQSILRGEGFLPAVFSVVESSGFSEFQEAFSKARTQMLMGSGFAESFEGNDLLQSSEFKKWAAQVGEIKTRKQAEEFVLQELRGSSPADWNQPGPMEFLKSVAQAGAPIRVVGENTAAVQDIASHFKSVAEILVEENFESISIKLKMGKLKTDTPALFVFTMLTRQNKIVVPAILEFGGLTEWPQPIWNSLFQLGFGWKLQKTGFVSASL